MSVTAVLSLSGCNKTQEYASKTAACTSVGTEIDASIFTKKVKFMLFADMGIYKAHVAKAKADYKIAEEKCDDLTGKPKEVCKAEAKAVMIAAKADAKAKMETLDGK